MRTYSIIVPALNAEGTLANCLRSLQDAAIPDGFASPEIILVDNGSTDRTGAIAREHGVTVLLCRKRGQGAARNMAIRHATSELILATDSDCVVEKGWAVELLRAFDDPTAAAAGGRIIHARNESLAEKHAIARDLLNQEQAIFGLPGFFLGFVITANAAFRRAALREVGGFDERIHPSEDADLSWRLQLAGWRIAYAEGALVRHYHRANLPRYWRQIFGYGVATANLFAKHRHRIGRNAWFGVAYSGDIRRSIQRIPLRLLTGRTEFERWEPVLDLVTQTASLAGRIVGSLRNGVVVL